jgi:ABC-type cobalamin/Fe3+-siderophores transport system ATPase subunit
MFKLNDLAVKNHPSLGTMSINFYPDAGVINSQKIVLIGPNGVGKSSILYLLTEIFIFLKRDSSKLIPKSLCDFELSYYLDDDLYHIFKNGDEFFFSKNLEKCSRTELALPEKLIVSTLSVSERFPLSFDKVSYLGNDYSEFYQYFGTRSRLGGFSHSQYLRSAFDVFIQRLDDKEFNNRISTIFKYLGYQPRCRLVYRISSSTLRNNSRHGYLSDEFIEDHITAILNPPNRLSASRRIPKYIVDFLESQKNRKKLLEVIHLLNVHDWSLNIDFKDPSFVRDLLSSYHTELSILLKIGIIRLQSIHVIQKGHEIDLKLLSSGEIQLFCVLTSLAGSVTKNSLVLIDEPDISLHPLWQGRFIEMLDKVLSHVHGINYLIVTHSPFIISDIKSANATILRLSKDHENTYSSKYHGETFGKSIEEIMLEVFDLPTSRSFYLSDKVAKLAEDLQENSGKINSSLRARIKEIHSATNQLSDTDPLRIFISKLKEIAYAEE